MHRTSQVSVFLIVLLMALGAYAQSPQATPSPSPAAVANANVYVRPTKKERAKRYANSVVGPFALGRYALNAGIASWRKSPAEWGDNWSGFGRRYASAFGKSAISNTAMYALDETLKVDSYFYRSKDRRAGARFKNAVISPFTARTASGRRVIGIPRIVGTLASNTIAYEGWYPRRYDYKDGLRSSAISFGFNAGFNLIKEFIWKKK